MRFISTILNSTPSFVQPLRATNLPRAGESRVALTVRRRHKGWQAGLWLTALGLFASMAPTDSSACINETERVRVPSTGALVAAETQANEGNLDAAFQSLITAQPRISIASAGMSKDKDRAIRIASRILARASNAPFKNFPSDEEQIKWAFLQVRKMKEKTPDDPSLLTDFGEIAARLPTERLEAMRTLAKLEEKDLVASAFGYATLARLRKEIGSDTAMVAAAPLRALHAPRREISLLRCQKLAKNPALCERGLIPISDTKSSPTGAKAKTSSTRAKGGELIGLGSAE